MYTDTLYETEERRANADFPFFCYRIPADFTAYPLVPAHWHNETELFYAEACGRLFINDREYRVDKSDVFFINPRQIHRTCREERGCMLHIVFDLRLLKTECRNPVNELIDSIISQKKQFAPAVLQDTPAYADILGVVKKIIDAAEEKTMSFGYDSCRIASLLFELMATCYRHDRFECVDERSLYGIRYVAEIKEYINGNYQESLNVASLARKMNMSESYLYRLFRDYAGITPINYINSVRLRTAYGLLRSGKNVTETAEAVGIPNVSYFIKLFKTATGQTHLSWIKNKKADI